MPKTKLPDPIPSGGLAVDAQAAAGETLGVVASATAEAPAADAPAAPTQTGDGEAAGDAAADAATLVAGTNAADAPVASGHAPTVDAPTAAPAPLTTYTACTPISMGTRKVAVGETLELDPFAAQELLAIGAIAPVPAVAA